MKLTEEHVKRTKHEDLRTIKNLNMWGSDLDDVEIVGEMTALEVASLSINQISTLQPFSRCASLRELYLRKNRVGRLEEVCHLAGLTNLRILWLSDNPLAELPSYRSFVVCKLPQLEKLDETDITPEERSKAAAEWRSRTESGDGSDRDAAAAAVLGALPPSHARRASDRSAAGRPTKARNEGNATPGESSSTPRPAPAAGQANGKPAPSSGTQQSIMIAMMALLEELDTHHMQWLRSEVDRRLS